MKEIYTTSEICATYNISKTAIQNRIFIRKLPIRYMPKNPKQIGGRSERYFFRSEVDTILSPFYKKVKPAEPMQDIYIIERVLTFTIYESKMNYLP